MDEKLTINQFTLLSSVEQYNLTFNIGSYIDSVKDGERTFALYSLFSFYVEVEYNQPENSIVGKKVFEEGDEIKKYVNWEWKSE